MQVSELPALTDLFVVQTKVTDLEAVSLLSSLRRLGYLGNFGVDLSPLAGLTDMLELDLRLNDLSDLESHRGLLTAARQRGARGG